MANISGSLIFDINRNALKDYNDYGIDNIPIVLQNTLTNERMAVNTDSNGNYIFLNVPNGEYRIIVVYGYNDKIVDTPGIFIPKFGIIPQASLPPYTLLTGAYPIGTNHLNAVTPTTVFVKVEDEDVIADTFFVGPARYESLENSIDRCASISKINLVTIVDYGTFGFLPPGTSINGGPPTNPFPSLESINFTFVQQKYPIHDGEYSIGNTIKPYREFYWWRLSDHTTSIETGMMQIINGSNAGAKFLIDTVDIDCNKYYFFSAWVANIDNNVHQEPPQLSVVVEGDKGNVIYNKSLDVLLPTSSVLPMWKEVGALFNSMDNERVTIYFCSDGGAAPGNDYAIDDIYLREIKLPKFKPYKLVDNNKPGVGEEITYTVTISNTCENPLTNIIFQDTLQNGISFVNDSVDINGISNPLINPIDGFTIPNILGNSTSTISFKAIVSTISLDTIVNNQGNITYNYTPIQGVVANSYNESTNVVPININKAIIGGVTISNNSFQKLCNKEEVEVNDTIEYTIIAKNIGNVEASNIEITDEIPKGTSYIKNSITSTVEFTGTPESEIKLTKPLQPGEEATIKFNVTVDSIPEINPIPNQALIKYNYTSNPNILNGETGHGITNKVTTKVIYDHLYIIKSENINVALIGDTITYTLIVLNIGDIPCNNVVITDNLESQLTFNNSSLTINGNASNENIENGVNLGTLQPGDEVILTFKATLDSIPSSGSIENIANASYSITNIYGTKSLLVKSNSVVLVVGNPKLQTSKTCSKQSAIPGDILNYTINVVNTGNMEVENVVLNDELPPQLILKNITVDGDTVSTNISKGLNIGNFEVGQSKSVIITVEVGSGLLKNFQNIASAIGTVQPNPSESATKVSCSCKSNNLVSTTNINTSLSIIKLENINNAVSGDTVTYTLKVVNTGNVVYNNLIITDNLPSQLTFKQNSLTINGINSNGNIERGVNIGSLRVGETSILIFEAIVNEVAESITIENTANASYSITILGKTQNLINKSNTVKLNIQKANILVTKQSSKQLVLVGDNFEYTITVENTGNIEIKNITLEDTLPKQIKITEITIDGINTNTTILQGLNIGDLSIGQIKTIVVTVEIIDTGIINFKNIVTATGNIQSNINQPTTKIIGTGSDNKLVSCQNPEASLSIVKSEDVSIAMIGDIVTYTLQIKNTGNIIYNDVIIKDNLAPQLTLKNNTLTINKTPSSGNIQSGVNIGNLDINQEVTLTFKVIVNSFPQNGLIINNIANANYTVNILDESKELCVDSNLVKLSLKKPSIVVSKISNSQSILVGETFQYTITVENTGNIIIQNIILTDPLPPQLKIVNITINGNMVSNKKLNGMSIGSLDIGESSIIVVTVRAISSALNSFINKVTVMGIAQSNPNEQPISITDTSQDPNGVTIEDVNSNLSIVKLENISTAIVGDTVIYTLVVTNIGNIIYNNVIIQDDLATQLKIKPNTLMINGISSDGDIEDGVNIGTLEIGQEVVITFEAIVENIVNGNIIENTANATYSITIDSQSEVLTQKSNTVQIDVKNPNLNVLKVPSKQTVVVGDFFYYIIIVENTGDIELKDVTLTDEFPKGLDIVAVYIGETNTGSINIEGLNIGNLDIGQINAVFIKVKVEDANSSYFTNVATLTGRAQSNINEPYQIVNASGTASRPLVSKIFDPNIEVVKLEDISTAIVGDIVTYTIIVTNTGFLPYNNVILTDKLNSQLTFNKNSVTIDGMLNYGDINNGINIGNLDVGQTTTIRFSATVNSISPSCSIENTANISYNVIIGEIINNFTKESNTVNLNIENPQLEIVKESSKQLVDIGDNFEYIVKITNTGNIVINNILLRDYLPRQFEIVNITIEGQPIGKKRLEELNIGSLNVGESKAIVITIKVTGGKISNFKNIIVAKGNVQSNKNEPIHWIKAKGEDTKSVTVNSTNNHKNPKVKITKCADKCVVCKNGVITYTIVIKNEDINSIGTHEHPVVVYDILSPYTSYIGGSLTIDKKNINIDNISNGIYIGYLYPGECKVIKFKVKLCGCPINIINNKAKVIYGCYHQSKVYCTKSNIVEVCVCTN